MSSIVSEQYQFVIGVDTHAATHTFALVAGATRAVLDHAVFPTSAAGLSRAEDGCRRCTASRTPQRTTAAVVGRNTTAAKGD